jgi:uncharacterized glyoxalase superfamily protein PhnB
MSNKQVKAVPDGMHTVTPHLVCFDAAAAIDFYRGALGAEELSRMPGPDGKLAHAAIRIGDSTVFLADENPEHGSVGPKARGGASVTLHLSLPDADVTLRQAVASGAEVTMPMWDTPWGDRYGQFRDPFGHTWAVATHVRDVSPEELNTGMAAVIR